VQQIYGLCDIAGAKLFPLRQQSQAVGAGGCHYELLGEQFLVERMYVSEQLIETVTRDGSFASGLGHPSAFVWISEEFDDMLGKLGRVARRGDEAYFRCRDDVAHAAHIRADGGAAGGEALDERNRSSFIFRCQQKHVRGRVQNVEIAPPSEEPDVAAHVERGGLRFERAAQLAVARDQENRVRLNVSDLPGCVEEQAMVLDGRQTSDRCDYVGVRGNLQCDSSRCATFVVDRRESIELEAERHDAVLADAADVVPADEFIPNTRRHGGDAVGHVGQLPLDADERRCGRPSEIAFEHVAVIRVNDACSPPTPNGAVVGDGRQTSERAGLRHMRMDDVGPEGAERSIELPPRPRVVSRSEPTLQCVHMERRDRRIGLLEEVGHVPFALANRSVHEERLDAPFRQPRREIDRLYRRAADVQARDDSRNAHAADDITRRMLITGTFHADGLPPTSIGTPS
jgi:hypothetical protein